MGSLADAHLEVLLLVGMNQLDAGSLRPLIGHPALRAGIWGSRLEAPQRGGPGAAAAVAGTRREHDAVERPRLERYSPPDPDPTREPLPDERADDPYRTSVRTTPDISVVARRADVGDRRLSASTRLEDVVVGQAVEQLDQAQDRLVGDLAQQPQRPLQLASARARLTRPDRAVEQPHEARGTSSASRAGRTRSASPGCRCERDVRVGRASARGRR